MGKITKSKTIKKVTKQQIEVFQMYADGFTLPQIAKHLKKSETATYSIINYFKKKHSFKTITNACCELIRKEIIF